MITFVLPCYKEFSGGITRTIELSRRMQSAGHSVQIRFQRVESTIPDLGVPYTIGPADASFPVSDAVITYSDDPYCFDLTALPQVKRVLIYMLSYGMCIDRERKNILNHGLKVMSSTLRTKKLIQAEGVECFNVGFGEITVDPPQGIERKRYAALMYHPAPAKRYDLGVKVCDELFNRGLIEGVLTFGVDIAYEHAPKPGALVKHFPNATRAQVLEIFGQCSVFIMPSITEGLNMTPIESTLCGCPAVICDGAIGEIFLNDGTCLIAEKDNFESIIKNVKIILNNKSLSRYFKINMEVRLGAFSWGKTIANIEGVLTGA